MEQFKNAWLYAYTNWRFFLILALPVIAIESLTGYLLIPLQDMTQPEDFLDFFESNSSLIALVGLASLIVQISFLGGVWVGYMSIDTEENINPISALQAGFLKFLPLFGAYIIVTIAAALGYLMLILPGIYLSARFSLFAAHIMYEDKRIFQSIGESWEKTDEFGSKLFMFTLTFFILIFLSSIIITTLIPTGIVQAFVLAILEIIFVIPLGYIYFTLYKSLKVD